MAHVANVTIAAAQVAADLTDFPVYVDLSDLPAGFWSTVASGGGDIRCYKSDGTTQLPREVVTCDTGTETGELWVLFDGVLSSSSDTVIQIHADGSSSEPAAGSTYGSEAVWAAYDLVMHLQGSSPLKDSASSATYTFTDGGNGATGDTGQIGDGVQFGRDSYIATRGIGGTGKNQLTVSAWVRLDGIYGGAAEHTIVDSWASGALQFMFRYETGSGGARALQFYMHDGATQSALATDIDLHSAGSGPFLVHGVLDSGGTMRVYKDATASSATDTAGTYGVSSPATMRVGTSVVNNSGNDYWDGLLDEVRVSTDVGVSADWISTEHANQSAPGTFYTAAAPAGGITETITAAVLGVWTGQALALREAVTVGAGTAQAWTGQAVTERSGVQEVVGAGALAAWTGAAVGIAHQLRIGAGTLAAWTGQAVTEREQIRETVGAGTLGSWTGQAVTEYVRHVIVIAAGTLKRWAGAAVVVNGEVVAGLGRVFRAVTKGDGLSSRITKRENL